MWLRTRSSNISIVLIVFFTLYLTSQISCHMIQIPSQLPTRHISTPIITIWVHGSIFFYHRYFLWLKRKIYRPSLSNNEANPQYSLRPAQDLHSKSHLYQMTSAIAQSSPQLYPIEHFYAFRWSGKMHSKALTEAANRLYDSIKALHQDYKKKYGIEPFIRIISHSNGCNVALCLAQEYHASDSIRINELILLACPIQEDSIRNVNSSLFQRVYHIFSQSDWLQTCAYYRNSHNQLICSKRFFPVHPKLRQVDLTIDNKNIWHYQFRTLQLLQRIPMLISTIDYIFSTQEQTWKYIWHINLPTHF